MDALTAILAILAVVTVLYELARRIAVPYPTLFVIGGLALGVIPGLPKLALEPELVLLVFLPPLLFGAAIDTPVRELRANIAPLLRLSVGLVVFTMVLVAIAANMLIPGLGWAAAFTLGAIVAPTDALAATSVFRRIGAPRIVVTLVEGESLLNDATALVAYRAAVVAVATGSFVLTQVLGTFVVAALGGIVLGVLAGAAAREILRRLDNAPVEVAISLIIPYAAYLPAERLGLSGVLAAVAAGLVVGSRFGTILTPSRRVLWLTTWKMIGFVLNGFVFVLIGLELPAIIEGLEGRNPTELIAVTVLI
ncbi:MAG: cation:proton antiporter, partial [Chloroflexi bacterium]|nr:cation:proton antiporter [Chloroflexota bacterium]